MYSLALALSMVALEEAAASAADSRRATEPDPAPLDAAGREALMAGWRRWAAAGRAGLEPTGTSDAAGPGRQRLASGARG